MAETGRIHIDLTEELEQNVTKAYEDMTQGLITVLGTTKNELEELCNNTKYEPLLDVVNRTLRSFQEEVRSKATEIFEEWREGNASFSAAARFSEAGNAALETAQQIDGRIADLFEDFWSQNPFAEEIGVNDLSRPVIRDEDFDTLEEIYKKASEQVAEDGEQPVKQIQEKGKENPTYLLAVPPMTALAETLKNAFHRFTDKVKEFKEESQDKTTQQEAFSEEMAQSALSSSANVDDIAAGQKLYGNL